MERRRFWLESPRSREASQEIFLQFSIGKRQGGVDGGACHFLLFGRVRVLFFVVWAGAWLTPRIFAENQALA